MPIKRWNPRLPIIERPCWKYVVKSRATEQAIVNTYYYFQSDEATKVPTLPTVHGLLDAALLPSLTACQNTTTVIGETRCSRFDINEEATNINLAAIPGTRDGNPLPYFVSAAIWRLTGYAGQRARGMVRVGVCTEEDTTPANFWTAPYLALLNAHALAMRTPLSTVNPTDGTLIPALMTRIFIGDPEPTGVVVRAAALTDTQAREWVGSQDTRKPRFYV